MVRIGYGSNKKTRGLLPNGFKKFVVHNVKVHGDSVEIINHSAFVRRPLSPPALKPDSTLNRCWRKGVVACALLCVVFVGGQVLLDLTARASERTRNMRTTY